RKGSMNGYLLGPLAHGVAIRQNPMFAEHKKSGRAIKEAVTQAYAICHPVTVSPPISRPE
ncbi:MAG: hypothetical protein KGI66_05065, partial [Patescibacteria group bacterium]|nr:hypothetical protein [Patescibacteria group bacterium]